MIFEIETAWFTEKKEILKRYPILKDNAYESILNPNVLYIIVDDIAQLLELRKMINKPIIINYYDKKDTELYNKILIYDDWLE